MILGNGGVNGLAGIHRLYNLLYNLDEDVVSLIRFLSIAASQTTACYTVLKFQREYVNMVTEPWDRDQPVIGLNATMIESIIHHPHFIY